MSNPCQDCTLYCSPVCNSFIWIDGPTQLPATKLFTEHLLNLRDTSRATYQHNVINLRGRKLGILQHGLHSVQGAPKDGRIQGLKLASLHIQGVFLSSNGQLYLGTLCS
mmetsp:Transcript_31373/g.71624  ORF Transcript_31373/g.71624 Transcript_31373/m.71624 type:complete len:109 (+) Transcript_31373:659-985(+)